MNPHAKALGKLGGKVKSEAKRLATSKSLEKARAVKSVSVNAQKVAYFESLGLFPEMQSNEWKFKMPLSSGGTYNPDYFDPASQTYIEVVTSVPNVSEQQYRWAEALGKIKIRFFWWTGDEITWYIGGAPLEGWTKFAASRENGKKGGRPRKLTNPKP